MSLKEKILGVIVAVLALFGVYQAAPALRGAGSAESFAYATTTGSFANASSTMLRVGQGEVGVVVIGTTSGTTFQLRDANSTSDTASTTLLSVAASPVIGSTMTLKVQFTRGLFIEFPASFVGRYTITYD